MDTTGVRDARILLVDDDIGNLRALERILRRQGGWRSEATTDSRCVRSLLAAFEPDLLITDLHMPHLDGFEVMDQVRSLQTPGEYFPIVVISSDLSREACLRALRGGAKDFVSKPFDDDDVTKTIHHLLETRFLHEAHREQNRKRDEQVEGGAVPREHAHAHFEVLERLARAAELRDDGTGEHTRRVGELSASLARRLGLPPEEVEILRRAAALHDVGQISTPDSVLLKPGQLTPAEQALMRRHTVRGACLLFGSPSPLVKCAEEIAFCHHEWWDGTGYEGLAGESIPLSARIVAVADVFDALTRERPYQQAWTQRDACDEIRRQSGLHFDPRVADAFLATDAPALPAAAFIPEGRPAAVSS